MARHDPDNYEVQQFRATAGTDNLDEYLKAEGHPGVPGRSWPKMPCDKAWDRIVRDRQLSENEPEALAKVRDPKDVKRYSPYGAVADAIKYYIRKSRFATIQSVADKYREKIKTLWPMRRIK